jgi:2-oxo-3-hexenedioate decarboxylase
MKHEINLHTMADEIMAAQDQCRQMGPLTARLRDFSNVEAYAVAQLIHEMRVEEGAVPVGRKIGFTNPEMWSIYGVCEPIWGYIYDTTVVQFTGSKVRSANPILDPQTWYASKLLLVIGYYRKGCRLSVCGDP